jgi:nucleoside 2-deoxyribosyltransferase
MKIYVASLFRNKDAVREAEQTLRDNGYEVTSRWVNHEACPGNIEHFEEDGLDNMLDLERADTLLVLWPGRLGTASELGFAIGSNKAIFIVSDGASIDLPFAYLPGIVHISSVDEFMALTRGSMLPWQGRMD